MRSAAADTATTEASLLDAELIAFFEVHYGRITRLAGLVCHSASSAEDAVQAAMEQAWRHRSKLREPSRLRPWLDRIVVREAIRLNRRPWWARLARPAGDEQVRLFADPRAEVSPDRVAIRSAFQSLSVEQRAACVLHLHLGYSVEETAELMGSRVETTRSRLRLARRRLRSELAEDKR